MVTKAAYAPWQLIGVAVLASGLAGWYAGWVQEVAPLGAGYWPSAGIAIGALVLLPRRWWPVLLLGVVGVQVVLDVRALGVVPAAAIFALANVFGYGLAAGMLRRWQAWDLRTPAVVLRFFGACATGGLAAGLLGGIGTQLLGSDDHYLLDVLVWSAGDLAGATTIAPAVFALAGRLPWPDGPWGETAAATVVTTGLTLVAFWIPSSGPIAFLTALGVVWVATRLRLAWTTLMIAVVAQLSVIGTAIGRGPFSDPALGTLHRSLALHLFLATTVVIGLALAARTAERTRYHDLAEARDLLLAAVSHELRTPLTPIVGFSELALRDREALTPEVRQALEVIQRNGDHLRVLIDQLLQATRLEHGLDGPDPTLVEVERTLAEVLHGRPGVTVAVRHPAPVLVWVDRAHLVQIVANLVDNATNHGQPPVQVLVDVTGDEATVTVLDAGSGVPDWFAPQLFDTFAQVTDGDRRPSKGLGLGLPIARQLAELNGGRLHYAGRDRDGVRFELVLPMAPASARPSG